MYNRKNLCDYMLLYVKTDALLLCDIFENFRDLSLSYYGLDPCHYFSLPGLSYDAMLQMTGVKLDLITDIGMLTMVEENIRGGVSTINHRLFTANNQYLSNYNPNIPTSYIMYVDANNLYGKGMSEKLPTGNFRWLSKEKVDMFSVHNIDAEGETCYILDVNLEYPKAIHDLHNDYPLAVECKYIEEADLSLYNQYFLKEHNEKFKSTKKLYPDLKDKKNYVCSLKIIKEVVALKPKMYSLLTSSLLENKQESHQTAKGITKVAQRSISHQDYLDTLQNIGTTIVTSKAIRSFSHQLYSIEIKKRGLSSYDDKKHILDNGINTLSYGHYKI